MATRALIAWNAGALLFIGLVAQMIARSDDRTIRARASLEDDNQWVLLLFGIAATGASLAAIFAELSLVKDLAGFEKTLHIGLTGLTIVSAWTFIHLLVRAALRRMNITWDIRTADPATAAEDRPRRLEFSWRRRDPDSMATFLIIPS